MNLSENSPIFKWCVNVYYFRKRTENGAGKIAQLISTPDYKTETDNLSSIPRFCMVEE